VNITDKTQFILIAEDDKDDQVFIKHALEGKAFDGRIECVENGIMLLDFLRQTSEPPGLILLDLNMPLKDGYETLRELKTDPQLRKIPTIILTSSMSSDDEVRCTKLGCNQFIRKPFSVNEYIQLADGLLNMLRA